MLFGSTTTKFGPLSRGQPHSFDVIQFPPEGHREPRNKIESLRPTELLVGFEMEPSDSTATPWTTRLLSFSQDTFFISICDIQGRAVQLVSIKKSHLFQWKMFYISYAWFSIEMLLQMIIYLKQQWTISQREKCPNKELFLVLIFLYLDWLRRFT